MAKVFISYRREDSRDITGRIVDVLLERFEAKDVFYDVLSVRAGADFRVAEYEAIILGCDVLLAIIGPTWLQTATAASGQWRPPSDDQVRFEIATALSNEVPVVPVLVGGATMPATSELPDDIRQAAYLNAPSIRPDPDFRRDLDLLWRELVRLNVDELPGALGAVMEYRGLPPPDVEYGWDLESRLAFERQFVESMGECLAADRPFYTYTQLPPFVSRSWETQIARQERVFEADPPALEKVRQLLRARYELWDRLERGPGVFVIADKLRHQTYFERAESRTLDLSTEEIRDQARRLSDLLESRLGFHLGLSEVPIGETFFCGSPTSVLTYNNVPPTARGPTRGVRGACYRGRQTIDLYLRDFQASWAELPPQDKGKSAVRAWLDRYASPQAPGIR